MNAKSRSRSHRIGLALVTLLFACLFLSAISAISNLGLPDEIRSERLSSLDKVRVLESLHLKTTLGDQVWRGWGSADIPVIVWNRSHEFLFNYNGETPMGWTRITDDDLNGMPCFRRTADNPQNFAVRIDGTWIASMATKQATDVFLINTFRDVLPTPIKQIFPYRFLIQPSETQIGGLLHETFHVFQYQLASDRMNRAEAFHKLGDQYISVSENFNSEWNQESAILADALKAQTMQEKITFVQQFLSTREARRNDYQLSSELISYERWLEWEEGTAKYVEVASLKAANESGNYRPLPEMKDDPDFKGYKKFGGRWSQELFQLRYQTTSGESQLYMTGMAQAFLLDDLFPDWKELYWNDNVFLEDILRSAITN